MLPWSPWSSWSSWSSWSPGSSWSWWSWWPWGSWPGQTWVEICRDRHHRRSCKIYVSCVNFPGKQRDFLHNLRRTTRSTHTKCDFALKMLRFDTLSLILTKKLHNLCIYAVSFWLKIVASYALLVCNTFGPKIWSCNFVDKSQVWDRQERQNP